MLCFCSVFFRLECSVFALFFGQNLLWKSSDFIYFCSVYIIWDTATVFNVHYCVQCTLMCAMYNTLYTVQYVHMFTTVYNVKRTMTQVHSLAQLRSPSQPTTLLSAHQAALSEVGVIIDIRTSDI